MQSRTCCRVMPYYSIDILQTIYANHEVGQVIRFQLKRNVLTPEPSTKKASPDVLPTRMYQGIGLNRLCSCRNLAQPSRRIRIQKHDSQSESRRISVIASTCLGHGVSPDIGLPLWGFAVRRGLGSGALYNHIPQASCQ